MAWLRHRFSFLLSFSMLLGISNWTFGDEPEESSAATPASSSPRIEKPAKEFRKVTSPQLDALLMAGLAGKQLAAPVTDEQFLRRATLDLLGRQPTLEELSAFASESSPTNRSLAIDRLLQNEQFGANWANYWSDTISYRVPQPELTFLNYGRFKQWLAGNLNENRPWSEIIREVLTASGLVKDNPAATFVGFHQGNATRLASETARIFLGLNLQCAQCHDHPFEEWTQDEYHKLAAFFARSEAKLPWNDSDKIEVKDRGKGEHRMPAEPGKTGAVMAPVFLTGEGLEVSKSDGERRKFLAEVVATTDNAWFSKAYVNRVWSRLMGRGFCEPVDNIGEIQEFVLPEVHQALADHFAGTAFDVKEMFRLIMNTKAYERQLPANQSAGESESRPFAAARAARLRSDEVFDSLVVAVGLTNQAGTAIKPTDAVRFPPPPKSTRDLVSDAFGFDPSLSSKDVVRTMPQVMLMMNNEQIQAQINSAPDSGTLLSKLVAAENEDAAAVSRLFEAVLARKPSEKESQIAIEHIRSMSQRGEAFEDLLWGLVNSAEFTSKR